MPWSRAFDDPIPLPRGRQLVTLKDAANYIQKLPAAEQDLEEWQAAVEALLLVVELNGPTMMARIASSEHRTETLSERSILIAKTRIGESGSWREIGELKSVPI